MLATWKIELRSIEQKDAKDAKKYDRSDQQPIAERRPPPTSFAFFAAFCSISVR
jgi:hypothetical protein